MALTKCKECGREVSTKAKICPNCGSPVKSRPFVGCLTIILSIAFIGIITSLFYGNKSDKRSETKTLTPETLKEIRKEPIQEQFSAWDGSHIGLTKFIKKTMNDPDSYEHVETVYWDKGSHLVVKTTFRKNWVMAKVDLNGNVIEVIEQGP
jgi:hypothetical protein